MDLFGRKKSKFMKEQIKKQDREIRDLRGKLSAKELILKEKRDTIERLVSENVKLLDWVQKVINDVGCYEVKENNQFRIPMIDREWEGLSSYSDFDYERKEVHLPEITIIKQVKRGEYRE